MKMGLKSGPTTIQCLLVLMLWCVFILMLSGHLNVNYIMKNSRDELAYRKPSVYHFSLDNPPQATRTDDLHVVDTESESRAHQNKRKHIHFRDLFNRTFSTQSLKGLDAAKDNSNYLIYRCDTSTMRGCGGWADRVKGMMSAYLLANLTGRVFKIEMILPPCDIQQYIIPNQINWSLPKSIHGIIKQEDNKTHIMNVVDDYRYYDLVKNINYHRYPMMNAKYVYYKANLDYMYGFRDSLHHQKEFSWMKNMTRDRINAAVFKHLFKLTPPLKNKIDTFLASKLKPTDNLICAHVRTGRNPTLPGDTDERINEEDFYKIWLFLHNVSTGNDSKIFLMTDSEQVKAQSRLQIFRDKFVYNGGHIVHMERSRGATVNEKCTGLETVLFEQFMLMHCDVLMISKSGLSRMAAFIRGSNQNLFCLLAGANIVPCRMDEFTKLYHIYG